MSADAGSSTIFLTNGALPIIDGNSTLKWQMTLTLITPLLANSFVKAGLLADAAGAGYLLGTCGL